MRIGVPKEIKNNENRVALTPKGAKALVNDGHEVLIQTDAGLGSGFANADYEQAGAVLTSATDAWAADLVLKVKEPQAEEYPFLHNQILFTYLHLAGVAPNLTEQLLERQTTAIAYETVEDAAGKLPLLAPMSAIAGNMAVSVGNYFLSRIHQGRGVLLGRVLDERHGKVVVLGDGVVGRHAVQRAEGIGAHTCIVGRRPERAAEIAQTISADVRYVLSTPENIAQELQTADLVVGAVLQRGGRAPIVVTDAMVRSMKSGAVIVDVSIDQGGCVETAVPTNHANPIYVKHDVVHYCVANMPGAYPRTSTIMLTTATLPYVVRLAGEGLAALSADTGLAKGVSTFQGRLTCAAVAEALERPDTYTPLADLLSS
ncbi:MAG: alanine dehydrogenase [Leptolyngbyaceae cyanobacterium MO_188.B28]|nr:alanine dehydrogenase [Leptolyngbyaceae cyanobacterium MO_188.B28]